MQLTQFLRIIDGELQKFFECGAMDYRWQLSLLLKYIKHGVKYKFSLVVMSMTSDQ